MEVFDEAQRCFIEIKIGLDLWDSPKPFILDEENLGLEKMWVTLVHIAGKWLSLALCFLILSLMLHTDLISRMSIMDWYVQESSRKEVKFWLFLEGGMTVFWIKVEWFGGRPSDGREDVNKGRNTFLFNDEMEKMSLWDINQSLDRWSFFFFWGGDESREYWKGRLDWS